MRITLPLLAATIAALPAVETAPTPVPAPAPAPVNDGTRENQKPWYQRIEVGGDFTGTITSTLGAEDVSAEGDVTDATWSLDLEVTLPYRDRDTVFVEVSAGQGRGVDDEVATVWGFDGNAWLDEDDLQVVQAWYEVDIPGVVPWPDGLRGRLGKLDLTWLFDRNPVANNEETAFVSPGFVNQPLIEWPVDNAFGATAWLTMPSPVQEPSTIITLRTAITEADGDYEQVADHVFAIVEGEYARPSGRFPWTVRLGGWVNGTDHVLLDGSDDGESTWGAYLTADLDWCGRARSFLRLAWTDPAISPVETTLSLGSQAPLTLLGIARPQDGFGWAYGVALFGSEAEEAAGTDLDPEHHAEVFYRCQLRDSIHGSLHGQWAGTPLGDADADDVFALTMRWNFAF